MDLAAKFRFGLSVLRYKLTGKRVPVSVAWLITGRCNLDCLYCKWKHLRQGRELDTAAAKAMIDQMRRAGVLLISFTGGEPLVRKDIGELIRHVKRHGLVCKLNTNGRLVPARLHELRPLDLLQISVDGPPSVQDRLRGAGSSQQALAAIDAARRAGIRVQLIACLTRDNVARLDDVLDYGLEHDLAFCFQILSGNLLDAATLDETVPARDALLDALRYLLRLKTERRARARAIGSSRGELEYYLDQIASGRRGCDCALVTATLLPDGQLIFCGNAKGYETFDAVELGFAEAFARLTIPDCDGCVCVGKLRLSKVYQLNASVIREMLRL
ncbi:MAG: radical SAM protein [Kiritimatiellae bacterium]|nr:radical SAM protein [Kiritimatiellia bacterium]